MVKAELGKVWVWTKLAEERARQLGIEDRIAGDTATIGNSCAASSVPAVWIELGYVESAISGT